MEHINKEQVKHVAHLSKIEINDQDAEKFSGQLEKIMSFADQLDEVDTEGVKPTYHVLDLVNVFRDDAVVDPLSQEDALSNAHSTIDGQFKVPQVMNDSE